MATVQKQKFPSGHGKGKWDNLSTISEYRKKRNATKKQAKKDKKKNRG